MIKHRTYIFFLVSMLAYAFIVSLAMASRGIVPVSIKDKSGNEIGLYKESHALVIGVSDYTNGWQDLESVLSEVNNLVSALEAQGFHVVKVMNPNSKTLENSFKDFINQYGFDPDNRLLFFFSGHGHTRQVGNITKGYLVPTDAPIPDEDPKGFKNKALSMKQIIAWAEGEIESKHALFLFDSCFSGTILKSRSKSPIPRPIKDSTNHPVRQFISAGSAGQLVPSQSVFTPYFIRALNGDGDMNHDGYVTGTELGLYLRDQIMGGDTHQTPQVGKSFNPNFNEGDFVFSLRMARLGDAVTDVAGEKERLKNELKVLREQEELQELQRKVAEKKQKIEDSEKVASVPANVIDENDDAEKWYEKGDQLRREKNYPEAVQWFRKAANSGNSNGQHGLADMYQRGLGVQKSYKESLKWNLKSAEQGNPIGQARLGLMYGDGLGVPKDNEKALELYVKSAMQGDPLGQVNLGISYIQGWGVEKDWKVALKWVRKSAKQHHTSGQFILGYLYLEGLGVSKDYKKAFGLIQKSAKKGFDRAELNLGEMYYYGKGIPKDKKEALKWYKKSAEQGNSLAIKRIAEFDEEDDGWW
jgi:TPR repeat protein